MGLGRSLPYDESIHHRWWLDGRVGGTWPKPPVRRVDPPPLVVGRQDRWDLAEASRMTGDPPPLVRIGGTWPKPPVRRVDPPPLVVGRQGRWDLAEASRTTGRPTCTVGSPPPPFSGVSRWRTWTHAAHVTWMSCTRNSKEDRQDMEGLISADRNSKATLPLTIPRPIRVVCGRSSP